MSPNPMTAAYLALVMAIDVASAYDYIARLKAHGCIERIVRFGRRPGYVLIEGVAMPADDRRGRPRRRIRAAMPISQITVGRLKP
jgi:hypothetical protein